MDGKPAGMTANVPHGTIKFSRKEELCVAKIVAIDKITAILRNRVMIGDKWIPVGENYRDEFRKRMFRL